MNAPKEPLAAMPEEYRRLTARIAELEQQVQFLRGSRTQPIGDESAGVGTPEGLIHSELFDNLSVCMFLMDVTADGRFRIAGFNKAEQEAVGLSNEQVAGRYLDEVFSQELVQEVVPCYRRALDAGRAIRYESDLNLPSGRRSFHTNIIPLRDRAGRIHRILGACIDITESKVSRQGALARQKLETVAVLAGIVGHDFGNLLGSILAESEVLLADLSEDSPVRAGVVDIRDVAMRASEVVRELMTYVGPEIPAWELIDISTIAREMIQLIEITISKRARLIVDLPDTLPAVHANPAQIRQVIMNLVTNASEALGEKEGVISLTVDEVRQQSELRTIAPDLPDGDYICLAVSDTGRGMTDGVRARIFDPLYTTKSEGRGLGLTAVHEAIRAHDGSIRVSTSPDKGSRFEILLPSSGRPMSRQAEALHTVLEEGTATGTILFVEDEEVLRRVASGALRKTGFSVIEAADGRTALEIFRANQSEIGAVLLDLTLPGLSGEEVLAELRRIHPLTRVILMTAYSEDTALFATAGQQPSRFIRKPYNLAELTALVRHTVDRPMKAEYRKRAGLTVMCMYCRRIRRSSPDGEDWARSEGFDAALSRAVSHGLCPECLDKHFLAH